MVRSNQQVVACYNFFKKKEGEVITLQEIVAETGWKLGTVKTYVNKKWLWFCKSLGRGNNQYKIENFNISIEDFIKLQSQVYETGKNVNTNGSKYYYDVALSFAGEDRDYVDIVAKTLRNLGVNVFYDNFEKASLWGKDLYSHLQDVYRNKSKYCVMFLSKAYKEKVWTNHERLAAQARAFQNSSEYILPARFDSTEIPGILPTMGYIELCNYKPEEFAVLIAEKVGKLNEIHELIAACCDIYGHFYDIYLDENVGLIKFILNKDNSGDGSDPYYYEFEPIILLAFYRNGKLDHFFRSSYIAQP